MELFRREIKVSVTEKDGSIIVDSHLFDCRHEMKILLNVDIETREIKEINATIINAPFNICQQAEKGIKFLVGQTIRPGINKYIKESIGGSMGCVHLVELISDSLRGVTQGLIARDIRDLSPEELTPKLNEMLTGSCLKYSTQGS